MSVAVGIEARQAREGAPQPLTRHALRGALFLIASPMTGMREEDVA
jgi:hypothetical protein